MGSKLAYSPLPTRSNGVTFTMWIMLSVTLPKTIRLRRLRSLVAMTSSWLGLSLR